MRISDWSSDVCSSDLEQVPGDASGNGCVIDEQTARLHRAERAILTQRDRGQIVIRTNTAYDDIRLLRRLRRTDGCFAAMFLHPCPGLRHRAIENRDVVPRPAMLQIGRASCRTRVCQYL